MASDCEIIFKIVVHTQFNESVRVVGDIPELGCWDPNKGFELTTNPQQYPVWYNKSKLMLKKGQQLNYKIVIFNGNSLSRWEDLPYGANRSYKVTKDKVLLEGREGVAAQKEVVVVDATSTSNLDDNFGSGVLPTPTAIGDLKRKRLSDKDFDPFRMAESEESSDDMNFSREGSLEYSTFPGYEENVHRLSEDRKSPIVELKNPQPNIYEKEMNIEEDDKRMTVIYEQFLTAKSSNRMFQPYNNFSHHESVFSYNEENVKLFNTEKISQLIVVSLAIPFSITILDDSSKTNTLFGRYSRIKFEEDKRNIAWNLYTILKNKLGSKLTWFGCVFDSYPLAIREDIRDSLTHSYGVVPIFIDDPTYSMIRSDSRKLTSYNEFKDGELEDTWARLENFNQRVSQFISHHCHQDATVIFLHKEFMLLPQLLIEKMSKLDMSFYWDECFPSNMYRTRSIYRKKIVAQSLLNCRSIIFLNQDDLRNFVDYCITTYSCHIISKKGVLILKFFGKQIAIDSKALMLQAIVPEVVGDENVKKKLQCMEQFLSFVTVFTLGQYDRIETFLTAVRGIKLLKGGKTKLFVICEGFNPPNCQHLIDGTGYQKDPNLDIEMLRVEDHSNTLEFLKRCDILIDEQNADISFNNLPIEFMIVNTKRALCLINSNYNTEFRAGNVVKCDFTSTKEIERGINKLIDKLLLLTPPATPTDIEKLVFANAWQSYEEVISAIQFISSLMTNSQLIFIKKDLKLAIAANEDCKLIKSELLNRAIKAQNRVIFISIDRLLKRGKKTIFTANNTDADIYMLRIFKQYEFNHVLLENIEKLAVSSKVNNVFIISARSQYFLENLFKSPQSLNLIAENGCVYKNAHSTTWHSISRAKSVPLEDCFKIMENYAYKFENAHIKKTDNYLRLKLKEMDRKTNAILLKNLYEELTKQLERVESHEVAIYDKSVHVRPYGLNKGSLAQIILQKVYIEQGKIDFVIAFGRTESDEEIFAGIRRSQKICQEIFTPIVPIYCKVGIRPSYGNYFTRTKEEILPLLTKLAEFV